VAIRKVHEVATCRLFRVVGGAKIAGIRGNTQGAEITWGGGAKMSRRAGGGGGKYKEISY
jgi:hypothetical protein